MPSAIHVVHVFVRVVRWYERTRWSIQISTTSRRSYKQTTPLPEKQKKTVYIINWHFNFFFESANIVYNWHWWVTQSKLIDDNRKTVADVKDIKEEIYVT